MLPYSFNQQSVLNVTPPCICFSIYTWGVLDIYAMSSLNLILFVFSKCSIFNTHICLISFPGIFYLCLYLTPLILTFNYSMFVFFANLQILWILRYNLKDPFPLQAFLYLLWPSHRFSCIPSIEAFISLLKIVT